MSITNFYTNQEIFITGGSGFVGKALIEKLIRSFPNIGKMFILIRSKNSKSPNERLEALLKSSVFDRAREEQPEAFSKIFAISGDCQELKLGISDKDLEKMKNVSLIFHSAASVRFDDHLKHSILLNTRGAHELVKIATTLKNLRAFVHISTSYSYPDRHELDEKVYPAYANWRTTIKLAETYDVDTLNIFFPKYSLYQPNSYTFTKCLAEHVINDYRHQLPILIFRPSIVVSSIEEPFPGWVDNFNGPIGMLVACGIGLLRTNYADPKVIMDFIPVDITIKSLLVAAYTVGSNQKKSQAVLDSTEVDVINCANASVNSITLGEVITLGKALIRKNPLEKCLWLPEGSITKCAVWHYIRFFSLQIGLALFVDLILRIANQKPFLLKLQRRIYAANIALYIFITTEWKFCNKNMIELENLIPPEDIKKLSFMRYSEIGHEEYFTSGIKGAKRFLLNEPVEATSGARLRLKIFVVLHYTIQFVAIIFICKFLIRYCQKYF